MLDGYKAGEKIAGMVIRLKGCKGNIKNAEGLQGWSKSEWKCSLERLTSWNDRVKVAGNEHWE